MNSDWDIELVREVTRRVVAALQGTAVRPRRALEPSKELASEMPRMVVFGKRDEGVVRRSICEIGERIWRRGFCAGNDGNISVRVGEDRVLCTPTGVSKGFMTPEMICVVDLEGRPVEGSEGGAGEWKRTSEVLLHLAIFRKRGDVGAVIHAHVPCATAFATAGIELPDGVHPEAEFLLGRVPLVEYAQTGKAELGARVAEAVRGDTVAALLANHGVVCFHGELGETYHRLEVLESYCELLMRLKALGQVRRMTAEEVRGLLELKASYGILDGRLAAARAGEDVRRESAFLNGFDRVQIGGVGMEALVERVVREMEQAADKVRV